MRQKQRIANGFEPSNTLLDVSKMYDLTSLKHSYFVETLKRSFEDRRLWLIVTDIMKMESFGRAHLLFILTAEGPRLVLFFPRGSVYFL